MDNIKNNKNSTTNMNPITLEFIDIASEEEYINKSNKESLLLSRFAILLTAFLYTIYGVLDPYTYPQQYLNIWAIRFVVVVFLLILFAYTYNKNYVRKMQFITFMQMFAVGGGLFIMFLFPEENSYKFAYMANYVLLPIGVFVITGLRFKNTLFTLIFFLLIIYIIVSIEFDALSVLYYVFLFTSVTLVSIGGAYFMELYKRKLFLKEKSLQEVTNKLENLSITDELTQIKNRRSFNQIIKREIDRARRNHKLITFMMVDIDFFKQYNDTYGHLEGDRTLIKVAKALENTFQRSNEFVFRLGGEEFGILLCDGLENDSKKLAFKMCNKIESLKIEHKRSRVHPFVTISVGICSKIVDDKIDGNFFLKNADDALYKAKESGRNRCVFVRP